MTLSPDQEDEAAHAELDLAMKKQQPTNMKKPQLPPNGKPPFGGKPKPNGFGKR